MPRICGGCGKHVAYDSLSSTSLSYNHFLDCVYLKSKHITNRHEAIEATLTLSAHRAGVTSIRHERSSRDGSNKREVDRTYFICGSVVDVDFVVTHPTCPSHVTIAARKQLAANELAERRKHHHHRKCNTNININNENGAITNNENNSNTSSPSSSLPSPPMPRLVAFAIETYGGINDEGRQLMREIAIAAQDHDPTVDRQPTVMV